VLVQLENPSCTSAKDNQWKVDMKNQLKPEAKHGRKINRCLTTEDEFFCSGQLPGQTPESSD